MYIFFIEILRIPSSLRTKCIVVFLRCCDLKCWMFLLKPGLGLHMNPSTGMIIPLKMSSDKRTILNTPVMGKTYGKNSVILMEY